MSSSIASSLTPIDTRAREVHDGLEPVDYAAPLGCAESMGLSASDLCRTRLLDLEATLGAELAVVCEVSKLTRITGPFAAIVDARGLAVYAFLRTDPGGVRELWVTSYGEFQPARYIGWILSVWRMG